MVEKLEVTKIRRESVDVHKSTSITPKFGYKEETEKRFNKLKVDVDY